MISDEELTTWKRIAKAARNGSNDGACDFMLELIKEVRRYREQTTPDCVNGCIFKQARKIAEG